nr:RecQ family ATP-dependent DNA helicase [Deinococcus budaensis]
MVFFDVETTSEKVEEAEIVEIAAVRDGHPPFHAYLATTSPVPDKTYKITHIPRDEYDCEKREPRGQLAAFLAYVGDAELAGHNIHTYDLPVLRRALEAAGLPVPEAAKDGQGVDTMWLARLVLPVLRDARRPDGRAARLASHQLGDLHEFLLGEPLEGAHRAHADVIANQKVFHALLREDVPQATRRLWSRLQVDAARFFPADPLGEDALMDYLRVPAAVPRVRSAGESFPGVDTLFPAWTEAAVREGRVRDIEVPAFLRAVETRDVSFTGVREVLAADPDAPEAARAVRTLAGSFRVKRQTDGTIRAPQAEMARRVCDVLQGAVPAAVIQAPTGTGKTKGYLFPAQHYLATHPQEQVIIATHTKVLQQQVYDELRGWSHTYATNAVNAKSARKYICLDALAETLVDGAREADLAVRRAHAIVASFAHQGDYDLEALPGAWQFSDAFRELELAVETHAARCRDTCPFVHLCGYQIDRAQRAAAQVIVTNQAWLLATMADPGDQPDRPRPHLVVDEAHNLEDVATEAFAERFRADHVRFHLRRLHDPKRRGALSREIPEGLRDLARQARGELLPRAQRALEQYDAAVAAFVKAHYESGDETFGLELVVTAHLLETADWQRLRRVEDELIGTLRALRDALDTFRPHKLVYARMHPALDYFQSLVQLLYARRRPDPFAVIHTTEWTPGRGWEHAARPVDLAPRLQDVWANAASVTLTSATLAPGGDFKYVRRTLGLPAGTAELELPEGLPYEKAHVLFPAHLPAARAENLRRFEDLYGAELDAFLPHTHRSLSLFTSRERMKRAGERLEHLTPIVPLTRVAREDAAREMARGGPRVAFGTRAFMEGVDFPHLKVVNLERIPFPVPDALLRARQDLAVRSDIDPWYGFYLPKALLTFTQAFGRLIRDSRNTGGEGAFVLWDKRILQAAYREVVFRSLPESLVQAGHLHRPADRAAFYDLVAGILGVDREQLPRGELLDATTTQLRDIRARVRAGELTREEALDALLDLFWDGKRLKAEQREAVNAVLASHDLLVYLPTGFGKSLTFQLPALLDDALTLVVSPLVALMQDQVDGLLEAGVPAAALHGARTGTEQRGILEDVRHGEVNLLYVSPERVNRSEDLKNTLRDLAREGRLRRVVFDEAHCLSEWGHDFRPDYSSAMDVLRAAAPEVHVTALTATAAPDTREQLPGELQMRDPVTVTAPSDRENLGYYVQRTGGDPVEKLQHVVQLLSWLGSRREDPNWSAIVYVSTRNAASRLAQALDALGFPAGAYHAGLSGVMRKEVQEQFMRDELRVMVATTAFGMGIDKPNVRAVIHFNPPRSLPAYVQEAGRAGRDGKPAWALLLHDQRDWSLYRWLAGQDVPDRTHAVALMDLLTLHGRLTAYPDLLIEQVNTLLTTGELLEADDLSPLLAALEDAEIIHTGYRVGKIRLLSAWTIEQLTAHLGDHHGRLVAQRGYRPGRTPAELDLSDIPSTDADALNKALYRLSLDHPLELLYSTHRPALEVTPLRASLDAFDGIVEDLLARKRRNLEGLQTFVRSTICRRRRLLELFGEAMPARVDRATCCHVCNRDETPWGLAPQVSVSIIEDVYRIKDTLLEFLEHDQAEYERRGYTGAYPAKGATRISMLLRGEVRRFVGKDLQRTLHPYEQRSLYFGRLEFVAAKEIERTLRAAADKGFVTATPFGAGFTFAINDAGRRHLRRKDRATRPERPVI